MEKSVIIVAGGQGMRFDKEKPKQFFYLQGRPLIMHTVEMFHKYDPGMQIILGLKESFLAHWKSVCDEFGFKVPHHISPGGDTRYQTVKNALPEVIPGRLVGVHDAVRPLVYRRTIDDCYKVAAEKGGALPCLEPNDSIREISGGGSRAVDRNSFRLVQTPQVFQYDILTNAYDSGYSAEFTDDASVVEQAGHTISLVEGNPENFKITTPDDLVYAEAIFESYRERCGFF